MITIPIDQGVMDEAVATWGADAQTFVAVEECAEFIQAAMKFTNRGGDIISLIEETAHALFLLMQIRSVLGESEVDAELVDVQARLRVKLEEHGNVHTART